MREQVRALLGIADADLSRSWVGVLFAEVLGGSVESWRVKVSSACSGRWKLGVGEWRILAQRVEEDERLVLARALVADLGLVVELEHIEGDPLTDEEFRHEVGELAVDSSRAHMAAVSGGVSPADCRALADRWRRLAVLGGLDDFHDIAAK